MNLVQVVIIMLKGSGSHNLALREPVHAES